MKKTVTIERDHCDGCGKPEYTEKCLVCGAEYCYDCRAKGKMVEYPHSVYCSGSGDGAYCVACDTKLLVENKNPLHKAFVTISTLRDESERFQKDFQRRCNDAENHLASLPRPKGR